MKKLLPFLLAVVLGISALQLSAQETITIGESSSSYYYYPVNMYYNYSLTQQIYTAEEITDAGGSAGTITAISFYYTYSSSFSLSNIKVYMMNVSRSAFANNTDMVAVTENDKMFEGTFSATGTGWTTITLDSPFQYNGIDNLLVCFYDQTNGYPGYSYKFNVANTTNYSSITYYSDSYTPDLTNINSFSGSKSYNQYHNCIQLEITAGGINCHSTGALSVSNITSDNAIVSWGAPEDAGTYLLQYKTASQSWDDENVITENPSETSFDFNDQLLPNTTYNVRVANMCNNGDTSSWRQITFSTPNIAVPLPYSQNFETNPGSITDFTISNNGANGWYVGSATGMPGEGSSVHSLYISNDNGVSNSYTNDSESNSYAVLDVEFDNEPMEWHLSFDYNVNGEGSTYKYDYLSVYIMDGNASIPTSGAPNGTALLYQSNLLSDWTHFDVILDNVIGTSKRIAFYWKNDGSVGNNPPAAVDNISIIGYNCMKPTQLTASDFTVNGATISWTGDASEYAVYLSGAMSAYYVANGSSYTFTDLEPSSTYSVQVRALCDDDSSAISQAISFNTACAPINNIPWTENFESYSGSGSQPFVCWDTPVTYNADNGTFPLVYCGHAPSCHSGVNSAEFKGNLNMLVLPEFNNDISTLRLSFYATATTVSYGRVEVGYMTDVTDTSTFVFVADAGIPGDRGPSTTNSDGWGNYMGPFDFSGVSAPGARIALRYVNTSSSTSSWNLDDFTVTFIPDCPSPVKNNVHADNIGGRTATITFEDNFPNHQSWTVYYRNASADEDDPWESVITTNTHANLSDLDPETTYDVYVVTNCGGTPSTDATLTISFTTLIACPAPTAMTLADVSSDEATITWTGTATSYNVEYGPAGFTPGSGISDVTETNSITLLNLTPNTSYTIKVKSDCTDNDDGFSSTTSLNFTTTQLPVELPYTADFSDPTDDWILNNGDCANFWKIGTAGNVNALFVTNDNLTPGYSNTASVVSAEKLITVGDHASIYINFNVRMGGESFYDYLKVFLAPATASYPASSGTNYPSYSTYGYSTNAADFSEYLSQTGYTSSSYRYKLNLTQGNTLQVTVEMPNPNDNPDATSTAKLVFLWKNDGSLGTQPGAIISNVNVTANTCPKPTAIADSNVTNTTADIFWTPGDDETEWLIEYGLHGFTQGTGIMEEVSDEPFLTLTNLSASSAYDVYVRALCSTDDSSVWVGPHAFFTACDIITGLPFTENFDSYSASTSTRPNCWSFPITYSNAPYITSNESYSSNNSLFFKSLTTSPTTAVTPQFDEDINNLRVRFMLKAESTTSSGTFEVGVMNDPNDVTTFESVQIIQPTNTEWNPYTINFDATVMMGTGRYIAFRQNSNSSAYYYWLDDVKVSLIPTCMEPSGLTATNPESSSVTLAWTSNGNESSWNIAYGPVGFNPETVEPLPVYENPYTLTNLTTLTSYEVYVQADCNGEVSEWSSPTTFATAGCDISEQCDYTFTLNDSFGDGWNGNKIIVKQNGVEISTLTFTSGYEATIPVPLCDGFLTQLIWQTGSYSSECSFSLTSPDGTLIISESNMSVFNNNAVIDTFTTDCSGCIVPSNLTYTLSDDGSSALISWTSNSEISSWILEYQTAGESNWQTENISGTPEYTLDNLISSTTYFVRVKSVCDDGESGFQTISFLTPCNVINTFTYTELFETGLGCWQNVTVTGDTEWETDNEYDYTSLPDGGYCAIAQGSNHGDICQLISPVFDLSSLNSPYIKFNHIQTVWAGDQDELYIYYRTSPSAQPVLLTSYTDNISSWQTDSLALPSPSSSYQIIFEAHIDYGYGIGLDMVQIYDNDGSSPVVTNPTVTTNAASAIGQNTATLNATITNPDNVTITEKGFEWRTSSGSTYTQVTNTISTGNSFSANLSNLAANTEYTFKAYIIYNSHTEYGTTKTFSTLNEDQPTCNIPTGLIVTDVTTNSAVLSWLAGGSETSWNLQYKTNDATWNNSILVNNIPTYILSSLEAETIYQVRVQANCDNATSDWTEPVSFTTQPVGIDNITLANSISLMPNPADNYIDLRISSYVNVKEAVVYNAFGQMIQTISLTDNHARIDLSEMVAGMYFIRVNGDDTSATKKFIRK